MRHNTVIFVVLLLGLSLSLSLVYINNGLKYELEYAIDVNHHSWFSKYVVNHGRMPNDNAYEYMPFSLLITSIISIIVEDTYSPHAVILRNLTVLLVYIIVIWSMIRSLKRNKSINFNIWEFLVLLVAIFPISYGLQPFYQSIHLATLFILLIIYSIIKYKIDMKVLFLLLFFYFSMILSSFSYAVFFILIFYFSYYLYNLLIKKFSDKLEITPIDKNINLFFKISSLMLAIYLVYIVLDLGTSFSYSIKNIFNIILELIKREYSEVTFKRTSIELSIGDIALSAIKIYGNILISYIFLIIISFLIIMSRHKVTFMVTFILMSIPLVSFMAIVSGYNAFRIINIVNIFLPFILYIFLYKTKNIRVRVKKTIVLIVFIFLFFSVFIKFTPIGFNMIQSSIELKINDENYIEAENITIVDYFIVRQDNFMKSIDIISNSVFNKSVICDRAICHTFMYVDRVDLYKHSMLFSKYVNINIIKSDSYYNITNINIIDINNRDDYVIIINYPVKYFTEEPIEYRSDLVRLRVIYNSRALVYNSGGITACLP